MFPPRYFPPRYFARRYWSPVVSGAASVSSDLGLSWQVANVVGSQLNQSWRIGEEVARVAPPTGGMHYDWSRPSEGLSTVRSTFLLGWQVDGLAATELRIASSISETTAVELQIAASIRVIATAKLKLASEVHGLVLGQLRSEVPLDGIDYYELNRAILYAELEDDDVILESWMNAA